MINSFETKNNNVESESNVTDENAVFHRKIYYQCKDFLDNCKKHVCFLYGPRKIGKTVCLHQIEDDYNALFFNMKSFVNDSDKYFEILDAVKNEVNNVIIVDEVTYIEMPEYFISELADYYTKNINSKVKVIITGSQSYAVQKYGNSLFGCSALYIRSSFIDFEEWLVYRGKIKSYGDKYCATECDYIDYVKNSRDFSGVTNNREYLCQCIDETIQSEQKSIYLMDGLASVNAGELDNITAVAYSVLIKLHNRCSAKTFVDFPGLFKCIRHDFNRGVLNNNEKINEEEFNNAINSAVINNIGIVSKLNIDKLQDYLLFLLQCDFIVITKKSNKVEDSDVMGWLLSGEDIGIKDTFDFFNNYCITFKYPLFYYNILVEIASYLTNVLADDLLSNAIYGSMVECHVRGLLSYRDKKDTAVEYRNDDTGDEVDYVSFKSKRMVEISISNKPKSKLKFDRIPDTNEYEKISLSKDWEYDIYKPYYKYILELSRGIFVRP